MCIEELRITLMDFLFLTILFFIVTVFLYLNHSLIRFTINDILKEGSSVTGVTELLLSLILVSGYQRG